MLTRLKQASERAARGALRGVKTAARTLASPFNLLQKILPVGWSEPPSPGMIDILEGYETMPWGRAIAEKVAFAVASLDWGLYSVRRGGGKAVRARVLQRALQHDVRAKGMLEHKLAGELRLEEDHVFYQVLDDPNPYMSRAQLLKLTEVHLDLVGDAYWVKQRNQLGVWIGAWPVPPHWVLAHPTPGRETFRMSWKMWQAEIPRGEMVWFHEPAPASPYGRGTGIGWSLGDELEVDEYAAKMAKALFFNQARPDFLVMGFDNLDEKRRVERDWVNRLQGWARTNKPYFLTGEPQIHEFQRPNMDQLVYPGLRTKQRDIVLQVWGAPPEMFGIVESSNRATIEAAEVLWGRWVILPRGERMRAVLQREIEQEYDERLLLHYTSPVPEDRQFILQVAKAAPHSRRVDEWRELQGLPPIGGDAGQALLVPLNSRLTDDLLDELGQRLEERSSKRLPAAKGQAA